MSDELLLFEVPYCPSPALLARQKAEADLKAWKERHEIFTHNDHGDWLAMAFKLGKDRLDGYELTEEEKQEPMALIAGYCRLLDEDSLMVDGFSTEVAACHALAWHNPDELGDFPFEIMEVDS